MHESQRMPPIESVEDRVLREERCASVIESWILIGLIAGGAIITITSIVIFVTGRWSVLKAALGA